MLYLKSRSFVDPVTFRCNHEERWDLSGPTNPLHDWAVTVMQTGGTCETPAGLPPLVCHEVQFKQNQKGGRGGFWLLFSTAKTPLGRDDYHRLTDSRVAIEIIYKTQTSTMRFDYGPDWLRAQNLQEAFEYLRCTWQEKSIDPSQWMFPTVQADQAKVTPDDGLRLITSHQAS